MKEGDMMMINRLSTQTGQKLVLTSIAKSEFATAKKTTQHSIPHPAQSELVHDG